METDPKIGPHSPRTDNSEALQVLELLSRAEPELSGPRPELWFDRLEEEHEKIRTALKWFVEYGDAGHALHVGAALWPFWMNRGHIDEGRKWLRDILALPGADTISVERAKTLYAAGTLAFMQGDEHTARACHEESLSIYRSLNYREGIADALIGLARVALLQRDHVEMKKRSDESLAVARDIGDKKRMATALHHAVEALRRQGDYERARPLYHQSIELHSEIGDERGVALELHNLGNVARQTGDLGRAVALFEESLTMAYRLKNTRLMAYCFLGLGNVGAAEGSAEQAAILLGVSEVLFQRNSIAMDPDYRPDYERSLAAARNTLHEEAFTVAWSRGQAMTPEQAVAYALKKGQSPPAG